MGFLYYAQPLFVVILAVTLYIMRRRVRLGRRVAKF
jgi:drug/metabolite transporter (DMT)-like permease